MTGSIIKNMALESSITPMVISMRVDGRAIKDMAKAHTGLLIPKINSEDSTLVIGSLIKNKEGAPCSIKLETGTMVCGWITSHTEKEE